MNPNNEDIIKQFNKNILNLIFRDDSLKPRNSEEFMEAETYKIFKKYLQGDKPRCDLFPLDQWKQALYEFLPDQLKDMINQIDLIDYPLEEKIDYNKILEEIYHNIKEIKQFAIKYIEIKNNADFFIPPVQNANVLNHLAIGIIAEKEKYNYYSNERGLKININA